MTRAQHSHRLALQSFVETVRMSIGRDGAGRAVIRPDAAERLRVALDLVDVTARRVVDEAAEEGAADSPACCPPGDVQRLAEAYALSVIGGGR